MASAEAERKRGQLAALTMAALVLVVGVPLWWRTTGARRAWLPVSQMKELSKLQLRLRVDVEVVFARGTLTPEQQVKLPLTRTRHEEQTVDEDTHLKYRYETTYRTATIAEEDSLNLPTAAEADLSLHMCGERRCGSVVVYVVPESSSLLPEDVVVYVGRRRTAVLRIGAETRASETPTRFLSLLDPRVKQVLRVMSISRADIADALGDRVRLCPGNRESSPGSDRGPDPEPGLDRKAIVPSAMPAFQSSPGYDITFSLLNADPKSHNLQWDIEGAVRSYVQPLLTKLAPVANFSVDSQILYYATLDIKSVFDGVLNTYTLDADSLARAIDPVEARLDSNAASSNPPLNFVLYVPDVGQSPLYIRGKQGVASDAFHLARWGGVMVYNVKDRNGPRTEFPVNVEMAKVMGVFLAQLRLMLGVRPPECPPGFLVAPRGDAGLADWELDRLMWSRSVENIATAATTVSSLARLLEQIGDIVVGEDVGRQLSRGVAALQQAVAQLEAGELASALRYSKAAVLASETAFFDPTVFDLLYFPTEQRLAICAQLVLLFCVPVLLSLRKMASEAGQRRRDKNTKMD